MSSFLLKATLRGTPNLVWRRFVVPSFTTLNRLHDILQTVMGWHRVYPHAFRIGTRCYAPADQKSSEGFEEEIFSLDDLAFRTGSKLKYIYDPAGEPWVHEVVVESLRYVNAEWPFPIYCLEGVRACPPESCGGPDGFRMLLKILADPAHPEYADRKKQFGSCDFNSFPIESVNKAFKANGPVYGGAGRMATLPFKEKTPMKKDSSSEKMDPLQRLGKALRKKAAS